MKRRFRISNFLLWILLVITFSSCRLIKSVNVPVNQATLNDYLNKKPVWTLEDSTRINKMIGDVSIRNDSIFGHLEFLRVPDHPPGQPAKAKTFRRRVGPYALSYMHLSTSEAIRSPVAIPISQISSATIHEEAPLKSTLVTLFGIVLPAVAAVAIICNCPYVSVVGSDTTVFQGS